MKKYTNILNDVKSYYYYISSNKLAAHFSSLQDPARDSLVWVFFFSTLHLKKS